MSVRQGPDPGARPVLDVVGDGPGLGEAVEALVSLVLDLPLDERVAALNVVRTRLHEVSPFKDEPVDLVLWVPMEEVRANQWNPNSVASPEMELLRHSIQSDGYTQPIVVSREGDAYEVVDGFHRNRVGKEDPVVRERVRSHLPVVGINEGRAGVSDRMASTVRHNRARGKHQVVRMSDIVVDLTRRGWSQERIAKELGMEPDEVLRLKQITGLADMFKDQAFSKAWDLVEEEP